MITKPYISHLIYYLKKPFLQVLRYTKHPHPLIILKFKNKVDILHTKVCLILLNMPHTPSFWRSLFRLVHIYAGIFIAPLYSLRHLQVFYMQLLLR